MTHALFHTSALLSAAGVAHGFSLRGGGVSVASFASLNLGRAVGDDPGAVEENLGRLARAAGLGGAPAFATAAQVHGDRVLVLRDGRLEELLGPGEPQQPVSGERGAPPVGALAPHSAVAPPGEVAGDAVISLDRRVAAAVRVADCVPVLLYEPSARAAAAVHAGWRGARLSIAGRAVSGLTLASGAEPGQVLAAVGPCIGRCCYEVSRDLAALFRALFGAHVADDPGAAPPPHLDLRACVEASLRRAGLGPGRIEQVGGCTACDPARYFSHRRDRGQTGRHLAFIVPDGR